MKCAVSATSLQIKKDVRDDLFRNGKIDIAKLPDE